MARPSDWWVLDLEADPTPGDPDRVELLADRFLDFAEISERAYRSVTSLAGDSAIMSWVGLSGDAFREQFGGFPDQLRKLYTSHQMAGDALVGYAPQLGTAQAQADRALADGREARAQLSTVSAALNSAKANATGAADHAEQTKNPGNGAPPPDPDQVAQAVRDAQAAQSAQASAQGAVDSAQSALDAAKSLAEQARQMRESAAGTCAKQINAASDAGIKPRSFWQKLGEFFKQLWDIICEVAKWVALIAGVIAMIIGGPLAWIALAAGAILLIKAIVDFSQGKGSVMDLVFGILGIIPGVKGLTTLSKLSALYKTGGLKEIGKAALTGMKDLLTGLANGIKNVANGVSQVVQKGLNATIRKVNDLPIATSKGKNAIPSTGDPVDVSTGRMFLTQVDLDLPGTLPLLLERTHRSDYRLGRAFGPSWASWLDQRIEVEADAVHLIAADGMLLRYPVPEAETGVLPVHGLGLPLRRNDDSGFVVDEPKTGLTLYFSSPDEDGSAALIMVADRSGNWIEVLRDEMDVAVEVRHSGGYRVLIESTPAGLVTAMRLAAPENDDDGHGPDPLLLNRFGYAGRRLVEVFDSIGRPMRFAYDDSGRIVRWEDRNGMWYRYEYDAEGRCVRTEGRDGFLSYHFRYDRDLGVTEAIDSLGATTVYQLNGDLQVIAETDPLGATVRSEWDRRNQLLARTDALGATTRYTYDLNGNLVSVEDPDGGRVTVEYAGPGMPAVVTGADGAVWRREYDDTGLVVAETDPLGATYRYLDDEIDSGTAHSPSSSSTSSSPTVTEQVDRNAAGLPIMITDGTGAGLWIRRDRFGRPIETTDAIGGTTRYRYSVEGDLVQRVDADGGVHRWEYDGERNLVAAVDPEGHRSRYEFSGYDLPSVSIDPTGARTHYEYDTELRLTSVMDPRGLVWRYEYDAAGRLVREVDFDGCERQYRHDPAGRVIQEVDHTGAVTEFTLDRRGNVLERRTPAGTTRFRYDAAGRIRQAVGAEADVRFERDQLGRIVAESVNGQTVLTRRDAGGRMTERVTPSGFGASWSYDRAGRPTRLQTGEHRLHFGYDDDGRDLFRQWDDVALITTDVDAVGRLTTQTVIGGPLADSAGPGRLLHQQSMLRAPGGRPIGLGDLVQGERAVTLDPTGRVTELTGESYGYNAGGDVTAASWSDASDLAAGPRDFDGTRLIRAGSVAYRYDEQGRTVSRTELAADGRPRELKLRWNSEDRLAEAVTADGERWRYRYDPFGRRIAKERVEIEDGRETVQERTEFIWAEDTLIEELVIGPDGTSRVRTWDRHPVDDRPLAQTTRHLAGHVVVDEQFAAVVTDQIGTPTALLSSDGELTWQRTSTLWGQDTSGPGGTPLRMPGQYRDEETGFHYNHQRYYDPSSGRYLSPDPLGLAPAANPVTYVRNPLTQADPLGLAPICPDYLKEFPGADPNYITQIGLHKDTKKFSQQHVRESEHVMPMKAILDSGLRSKHSDQDFEIAVSMPYRQHQDGRYGIGGGVSSTGSSKTATDWSTTLAGLLRNGENFKAYRMVVLDELNVSKHAAPGMMQYLDEVGRGTGTNGVPRLTEIEVYQLKQDVRDRYEQLTRLNLPDDAYRTAVPPKVPTKPRVPKVLLPSSTSGITKRRR